MPRAISPAIDPSDQMDVRNPLNFQQRCYTHALEFEKVYWCLRAAQKQMKDSTLFVSAMAVNSALSLEIYLKCLYHIESGQRWWKHQLHEIFYTLISPKRQHEIENLYNKHPVKGISLKQIFKQSDNAFDDWRYRYENAKPIYHGKDMIGFRGTDFVYRGSVIIPHVKSVILGASPTLKERLDNLCS